MIGPCLKPCARHAGGLHPNDFTQGYWDPLNHNFICRSCYLVVPSVEMSRSPTAAIINADRNWYIAELES